MRTLGVLTILNSVTKLSQKLYKLSKMLNCLASSTNFVRSFVVFAVTVRYVVSQLRRPLPHFLSQVSLSMRLDLYISQTQNLKCEGYCQIFFEQSHSSRISCRTSKPLMLLNLGFEIFEKKNRMGFFMN